MRVCGGKFVVLVASFFPLSALADDSQPDLPPAVATLSVDGAVDITPASTAGYNQRNPASTAAAPANR